MKRILSTLVIFIVILSVFNGCSAFSESKHNELISYVKNKGSEENGIYVIHYDLSEVSTEYEGEDISLDLSYHATLNELTISSTRIEDGIATVTVLDLNTEFKNQEIKINQGGAVILSGKINGSDFSENERAVQDYSDTSIESSGISENSGLELLGDEAHTLLTQTEILLEYSELDITLRDLGYAHY